MHSKLILVEGIPGAGKTTASRNLKTDLEKSGKSVMLYEEGMSHPADLSWQAYLTKEEYTSFLKRCHDMHKTLESTIPYDALCKLIDSQARYEDDHIILAYTKISFPNPEYWSLIGDLANKEIYDGRSSFEDFKALHLKRWTNFAKEAKKSDTITIFECAFLQNHIFELMSVYEKPDEDIIAYLVELLSTVKSLSPSLFYIKPLDVEKVINHAAAERKSPHPSKPDWIDEIAAWVERSHYGKHHHLTGKSGVISFCEERLRLDELAIQKLNIPVTVIERS